MKIKNKIIMLTLVMFSVGGFSVNSFAQQTVKYPQWSEVYTSEDLKSKGCDPNVMAELFNNAGERFMSQYPAANQILVVDQPAKAKEPKSMMNCVDRAFSAIKSITNSIDNVLGILSGAVSPGAVADSITKQMTNLACTAADNYITGTIYNSTSGIMGKINTVSGVATNGVYVDTGLGQVNVGGGAVQQKKITTTTDAVSNILK